jgi:hypothetical protein
MTLDDILERRIARYEFMKRAGILFTAVVVTVCLAILALITAQNSERGKENHELLTTVRDCTQPSGECYQRGQKRTASAVSDINQVIILAAACSAGLPVGLTVEQRQAEIQNCVIDRLAHRARKR